jgi:hypothetical protein
MDVVYAGNAGAIDSMDGVGRATQEAKADIQCQSINPSFVIPEQHHLPTIVGYARLST